MRSIQHSPVGAQDYKQAVLTPVDSNEVVQHSPVGAQDSKQGVERSGIPAFT